MKTIEKSAGQILKDFDKMMEEIKPYLPPPTRIFESKPQPPYRFNNVRKYRY